MGGYFDRDSWPEFKERIIRDKGCKPEEVVQVALVTETYNIRASLRYIDGKLLGILWWFTALVLVEGARLLLDLWWRFGR